MTLAAFELLSRTIVAGLGEEVIYQPADGVPSSVRAVVTVQTIEDTLSETTVLSESFAVSFASADVPGLAIGDAVTARGRSLRVAAMFPDGEGMVLAQLEEVAS